MEDDYFELLVKLKEQLQQRLSAVWPGVQQTAVDEATDEWRRYLRDCVHCMQSNGV